MILYKLNGVNIRSEYHVEKGRSLTTSVMSKLNHAVMDYGSEVWNFNNPLQVL